ncbi:uncharacterized protein Nmag_2169 [Natrialba magadii ATCC 43099]|uniref:Halobacterial output domain-containing protein n=1 Tax=Natrialba magadii (strain ATCC 43099 / DSM 3394 / CCM 3739 / CIP 104546 / IAM 13178 / JCM 8861 / NBRC 102185 / NCIMB 2190 / MS3) TaxID=547559 RepID=D3SW75_NATMM|nr:HalOD1 output domain-containing protein [Natrialba magadii]ADD05736.1 uncharacterized protein Nmag_2169 [Natrialba magadii ATCC 43099]ELY29851.1 hypothetical protein C500_09574 [Natrialba magadii ATCC 43099]
MTDELRSDGGNGDDGEGEPVPAATRSTYEITDDQSPSETVIRGVAALTNTPVLDLAPLYTVIDPTQLDELYEKTSDAVQAELSFTYSGCAVTVTRTAVHVRIVAEKDGNAENGNDRNGDTD